MYETPKLVVYGKFRELTLQTQYPPGCTPTDWSNKGSTGGDIAFPLSQNEACRS